MHSILALAAMFSQKFSEYPRQQFPFVHRGVDGPAFKELEKPFDFVIVGSGYAGSYLASKLGSRVCGRRRVLVLEPGALPTFDTAIPFSNLATEQNEFGYYTVPQKTSAKAMRKRKIRLHVGKALGGDSVVNDGVYVPPNFADFHRWSHLHGLTGWSYSEMKKQSVSMDGMDEVMSSEATRQREMELVTEDEIIETVSNVRSDDIGGNVLDPLKAAWINAGRDLNYTRVSPARQRMFVDGGFFGPLHSAMLARFGGLKMNPASEYLKKTGDNVVIITNAEVESLLYTSTGERVVGLQFKDTLTNTSYHVNVVKEVVLSAGAIGTAKILMQSGIGPAEHLNEQNIPVLQDLPVGVRLNDRVSANLYVKVRPTLMDQLRDQLNDADEFVDFLENGKGLLANSSAGGCALVRTGYYRYPDIMLEMKPVGIVASDDFLKGMNYKSDIRYNLDSTLQSFDRGCLQVKITVMRPFSTGTMWLWRRRRDQDLFSPRMNPSYLQDERDATSLVQGARHVEALMVSPYMAALGANLMYPEFEGCPPAYLPSTEGYWRCVMEHLAHSGNHLSGTAPLGTVVDSRLKVIGVRGLRVVDAGVFPEPATGGAPSTVLAIANKAFRMIRDDTRIRCKDNTDL